MCVWALVPASLQSPSCSGPRAGGSFGAPARGSWVCTVWRSFNAQSLVAGSTYKHLLLLSLTNN